MVRGRKEPRKKRKRVKGRVEERVWMCLLEVVPRRRLKPRHNDKHLDDGCSKIYTMEEKCPQSGAVAKLAIRAENYFILF